ncbi:MAG TPA: adenylate/guanylate cyclase domain-containing protein [Chitinophagaceae bacterium]|nr:adenylate/guanylate cyclase domain-containing protein [Chitinophagaceae bacterium]
MTKVSLKNIVGKKNDASALLHSLLEELKADIFIEDENGKLLWGIFKENSTGQYPVNVDNELLGWVKGDEKANIIANFLTHLAQKESEKKKLGSEVLNLYQEVNMIFNFSEKLAQAIDPASIAQITLDEASQLIKSGTGVIVLWDEISKSLKVTASTGTLFFDEEKINSNRSLLLKIVLSGQSEIIGDISSLAEAGIILPQVKTVLYAALKVNQRVMGAIILARHELIQYTAADLKLLTTLALQSSSAIESALLFEKNIREVKEREEAILRIHEVTKKFVPNEFIRSLGKEVLTDVKLGDQVEKIVTVLFSDIRNYTTLSEQMTPEENFRFVSSFNERMGPIIRKHHGFINQYLGDAIMAIFPGNASDCLAAAVEMQKAVKNFNKERELLNQPSIQIGVGMHTGSLIMGITGDEFRMDATTISDTVNTASRIESLTKYYKASIILSDATIKQIPHPEKFHLRNLGKVQVKGKLAPVGIYECFSGNNEDEIFKKEKMLPVFNTGMEQYLNKSFSDAIASFTKVVHSHPEDLTAELFIEKATRYFKNGVPANWAGVEEMMNK